ncbi:flagellin lysine-N-methylase [Bacillus sp. IBL03825]|nr:flagellin lysine-N-methylase [Bacillus sp. IBL03825]
MSVDKEHYDFYKSVSHTELTPLFQKYIEKKEPALSDKSYGVIQLQSSGRCPFLTPKNLSKIQSEYCMKALSKTCEIYPRVTNKINEEYYQTANLSCPEIARLILLSKTPDRWKLALNKDVDCQFIDKNVSINQNHLKNIHNILIDLLQKKNTHYQNAFGLSQYLLKS